MSLAADSRYIFGDVERVAVTATTTNIAVYSGSVTIDNVAISYYISVVGDRFDKLALTCFGDATKWWVLADMNPEVFWPGEIPAGTTLRIPILSDAIGVNSLSVDSPLGQFDATSSTRG